MSPRSLRVLLPALALLVLSPARAQDGFTPKAEHVVLVVWDGMRPDFVTRQIAPTLHALAKSGTFFARHHSIYITSTEVNGTAIATGCYSGRNGILANAEYRPSISPQYPFATESPGAIRLGDAQSGGRYVRVPTIAELVQKSGHRTAIAGTKPVALLHDRQSDRTGTHGSAVLFAGNMFPNAALGAIHNDLGKFPPVPANNVNTPNIAQNAWTTRVLIDQLWKDGVPKFSTLWLSDPDFSQHRTQPGSPTAIAAIRSSDAQLALLLGALERKGVRAKTDVFVVSDHGFSTIERGFDLTTFFKRARITIVREFSPVPKPGEVLAVPLGGSNLLYVQDRDPALIGRIVEHLQGSEFAGPIFTRDGLPGTFPLSEARIDSPDAADVVFSSRWRLAPNRFRIPGLVMAETTAAGYGTHASTSPSDIHNTLVAAGPDIRADFVDELPSGNVDVAPTILRILKIDPPEPLDGRVLSEALVGMKDAALQPETRILESTLPVGTKVWRQYLKWTVLGEHSYLDEGNFGPAPGAE